MLYVLSDLHLSHTVEKPMDIFGPRWANHTERIYENWQKIVKDGDTVVIPGDISWGMGVGDAEEDFRFIESLNGNKIIGKGNHDYWWQTMRKLNEFVTRIEAKSVSFLFNNAFFADGIIICGTRGWNLEGNGEDDEKIMLREAGRLRLSLEEGVKLKSEHPEAAIIVFMHYPPAYGQFESKPIITLFEEYNIKRCYYGHIHGQGENNCAAYAGKTRIICASADILSFKPLIVPPLY